MFHSHTGIGKHRIDAHEERTDRAIAERIVRTAQADPPAHAPPPAPPPAPLPAIADRSDAGRSVLGGAPPSAHSSRHPTPAAVTIQFQLLGVAMAWWRPR